MKVVDLNKYREDKNAKEVLPNVEDKEVAERVQRIKDSIERINKMMKDLKGE